MLNDTVKDLPKLRAELSDALDQVGNLRRRIDRLDREQNEEFHKAMARATKHAINKQMNASYIGAMDHANKHRESCWCRTCRPVALGDMRMVLCPECGNKRCPRARHHDNACTGSNEPGQPGSRWGDVKPAPPKEQDDAKR